MKRGTKAFVVIAGIALAVVSAAALAVPRYLEHQRYAEAEATARGAFMAAWKARNLPAAQFVPVEARYEDALSRLRDLNAASSAEESGYNHAQACHDLLSEYRWGLDAGKTPAQAEYQVLRSVKNDSGPSRCSLIE